MCIRDSLNDDLKNHMKLGISSSGSLTSYFTDYAVDQLTDDIVSEYGVDRSDAQNMIYSGGLKIYTTMDSSIQSIVEDEFSDDSNYAGIGYARTNSSGDLLDDNGDILLYDYSHYFNSNDEFTLTSDEYTMEMCIRDRVTGVSISCAGIHPPDGPPICTALNCLSFLIPPPMPKITSLSVRPIGTSTSPPFLIFPARANTFVPLLFSVPIAPNAAPPLKMIHGTLASVSTLFISVGFCQNPFAAGNGGLSLGIPCLLYTSRCV